MDYLNLTAEQILAIPEGEPERLYSANLISLKLEFHNLAQKWHPDHNTNSKASEVLARIVALKELGIEKIEKGEWHKPGELNLKSLDGRQFNIRYFAKRDFELGDFLVCRSVVVYRLDKAYRDFYDNALQTIASFKYADAKMEKEVSKYLPAIREKFETEDHLVLVLKKQLENQVLLRDLLDHVKSPMDPKHVAWVITRLYNTAMYFNYAGLTHNAINLDTVFVDPIKHAVSLLGGWWYSTKVGLKLNAVPQSTLNVAPPDLLDKKTATTKLDLELIKSIARDLLGDSGGSILRDKNVPKPLALWFTVPSIGKPIKDFERWDTVLKDSFGARRFVELNIEAAEVYPNLT